MKFSMHSLSLPLVLFLLPLTTAEDAIGNFPAAAPSNPPGAYANALPPEPASTASPFSPLLPTSPDSSSTREVALGPHTTTITVTETTTTLIGTSYIPSPAAGSGGSNESIHGTPPLQQAAVSGSGGAEKTVTVTVEVGSWCTLPGGDEGGDMSKSVGEGSTIGGSSILGQATASASPSPPFTTPAAPISTASFSSAGTIPTTSVHASPSLLAPQANAPSLPGSPLSNAPALPGASSFSINMPNMPPGLPTVFPDYTYSDTPPKTGGQAPPASSPLPTTVVSRGAAGGMPAWQPPSNQASQSAISTGGPLGAPAGIPSWQPSYQPASNPASSATLKSAGPTLGTPSTLPSTGSTPAPAANGGVSPNGLCGASNNGWTCQGSGFGDCCSQWGYCGSGPEFCGSGNETGVSGTIPLASVQPLPKPSSVEAKAQGPSASAPAASGDISPNGLCGPSNNGWICAGPDFGDCCSQWGYCGSGAEFCGDQNASGAPTAPLSTTPSHHLPPPPAQSGTPPPSFNGSISTNGLCGPTNNNWSCQNSGFGDCCSRFGYCGSGDDFCGNERIPGPVNSYASAAYSGGTVSPTTSVFHTQPTIAPSSPPAALGDEMVGKISIPEGLPTVFPDYTYSDTPPKTGGVAPASSAAQLGTSIVRSSAVASPPAQLPASTKPPVQVTGIYQSITQISRPPSKTPKATVPFESPTPANSQANPEEMQPHSGVPASSKDLGVESVKRSTQTVRQTTQTTVVVTKTMTQVPDAPPVGYHGREKRGPGSGGESTHSYYSFQSTDVSARKLRTLTAVSNATQRSRTAGYWLSNWHNTTKHNLTSPSPISYIAASHFRNLTKPGSRYTVKPQSYISVAMSWDMISHSSSVSTPTSPAWPSTTFLIPSSDLFLNSAVEDYGGVFKIATGPASPTSTSYLTSEMSTITITTITQRAEVRQVVSRTSENGAKKRWLGWWMKPRGRRMAREVEDVPCEVTTVRKGNKNGVVDGWNMYWGPFHGTKMEKSTATTHLANSPAVSKHSAPVSDKRTSGYDKGGRSSSTGSSSAQSFTYPTTLSPSLHPTASYHSPSPNPSSSSIPPNPPHPSHPNAHSPIPLAADLPLLSTHGTPTASYHSPAPKSFSSSSQMASQPPIPSPLTSSAPKTVQGNPGDSTWDPTCISLTTETILPHSGGSAVELVQTWVGCWVDPGTSAMLPGTSTPSPTKTAVVSQSAPRPTTSEPAVSVEALPSSHGVPTASYHSPAPKPPSSHIVSQLTSQPYVTTLASEVSTVTWIPPTWDPSCVYTITETIIPRGGATSALELTQTWTGCWVRSQSSKVVYTPGTARLGASSTSRVGSGSGEDGSVSASNPTATPTGDVVASADAVPTLAYPSTVPEWILFVQSPTSPASTAQAHTTSAGNEVRLTWETWLFLSVAVLMAVTGTLQVWVNVVGLGRLGVWWEVLV